MKKEQNTLVSGALLISLSGLIAKLFGALYRIPLTNIIGSYGMGLYQLVFPPYILVLTLASFGLPVATSKLVAEFNQLGYCKTKKRVFSFSLKTLALFGFLGCSFLIVFSRAIAVFQGNESTRVAFVLIAPSVLFVALSGALKGYFQGHLNMFPSSICSVIEQIVKLAVGLLSAMVFMPDVEKAVQGMVAGITISEIVSFLILLIWFLREKNKFKCEICFSEGDVPVSKRVFSLAFPVALGSFVMQLSQVIDSAMVVNLIKSANATALYGLWTGPVNSILGLPVALASGIAVSALPNFSKTLASADKVATEKAFALSCKLTLAIALPCALGLITLGYPILKLLYSSLPQGEIQIAATLLSLSAISVVFLSLLSTCISLLQASAKPFVSVIVMAIAIVLKAITNLLLLPNESINIYGAAISETICYLFASFAVIIYTKRKLGISFNFEQTALKPVACSAVMTLVLTLFVVFAKDFVVSFVGTLITIVVAGIVYFAMMIVLKVFDRTEIGFFAKREQRRYREKV